ncbi:MAG TPA: hypothetical protein VIK55_19045 [Paludibacter sp.]
MSLFPLLGKKYIFIAVWLIPILLFSSCREDISLNSPNGLIVILKADDLGDTTANWNRFMKMVADNDICAGVGVISKKVTTESSISEIQRISSLLQPNKFPIIEFWNHGYDHSHFNNKYEFKGTDYNFQFDHIQLAQNFFSKSLNFTCHSFGAPFNRTSKETASEITHFPEINVWMCYEKIENQYQKEWKDPNKRVINATDEHIILNVDYLYFFKFPAEKIMYNYNHDKTKPYILIQIHPAAWNDDSFKKFEQLIHFYKDGNRGIFMTPYQYYQYLHKHINADEIK